MFLKMTTYDYAIQYTPGRQLVLADTSRRAKANSTTTSGHQSQTRGLEQLSHTIAEVIRRLDVIKENLDKLVTNKQDELDDDELTVFLQRPL